MESFVWKVQGENVVRSFHLSNDERRNCWLKVGEEEQLGLWEPSLEQEEDQKEEICHSDSAPNTFVERGTALTQRQTCVAFFALHQFTDIVKIRTLSRQPPHRTSA